MSGSSLDKRKFRIPVAEDDPDDRSLTSEALELEQDAYLSIDFVQDGMELIDHLDKATHPSPDLIIVDLNMPCLSGFDTLKVIKANPSYSSIPVIVMSISHAAGDVRAAYDLGAAGYIGKPDSYEELKSRLQILSRYWTEVIILPGNEEPSLPYDTGRPDKFKQAS
ncbi:MAG: response regulator [Cohaesibacteraceae bacterium]|nr:response regulator [Cohaesibacteraceae bacterium]